MNDPKLVIAETKNKMQKMMKKFQNTLLQIRSGRASVAIVEDIKVNVYGQSMPLNQLAYITVPEARQIAVDAWDKANVQLIEKAIRSSGRNLNPNIDGLLVRVNLPDLTEENRKELAKLTKKKLEDYKVAIRNIRRDGNDSLKNIKEGVSEDELRVHQDEVQRITDQYIAQANEIQSKKEKEIMII